jgi:hypothetical protein
MLVLGVVNRILGIFLVKAIVAILLVKAIVEVDMSYFEHVTFWTCHIFPSGLCFAGC